jgi:hypothetical protein
VSGPVRSIQTDHCPILGCSLFSVTVRLYDVSACGNFHCFYSTAAMPAKRPEDPVKRLTMVSFYVGTLNWQGNYSIAIANPQLHNLQYGSNSESNSERCSGAARPLVSSRESTAAKEARTESVSTTTTSNLTQYSHYQRCHPTFNSDPFVTLSMSQRCRRRDFSPGNPSPARTTSKPSCSSAFLPLPGLSAAIVYQGKRSGNSMAFDSHCP